MKSFVLGSVLLMASVCSGKPVQDTPEVAAAKAAHFAVHAHVAAQAAHGGGGGSGGHGGYAAYAAPAASHWGGGGYEAPVQKWTGPIHIPTISKGVPVDTAAVQHAKAVHAAAYAKVAAYPQHGPVAPVYHAPAAHGGGHGGGAWHGPQHIPVIHNGVPLETPEVQHAKAVHLSALAKGDTSSYGHEDDGSYKPHLYDSGH